MIRILLSHRRWIVYSLMTITLIYILDIISINLDAKINPLSLTDICKLTPANITDPTYKHLSLIEADDFKSNLINGSYPLIEHLAIAISFLMYKEGLAELEIDLLRNHYNARKLPSWLLPDDKVSEEIYEKLLYDLKIQINDFDDFIDMKKDSIISLGHELVANVKDPSG